MDFDSLVDEIKRDYVSPKTLDLKTKKIKIKDAQGNDDILEIVKSSRYNLSQIIFNHHKFNSLFWDEFSMCVRYHGEKIQDEDITAIAIWLERVYQINLPETDIKKVINLAAKNNSRNPLVEYFDAQIDDENPSLLGWDGKPRLETVLIDYFGVLDTKLHRAYSRKFFIGAIRRALYSTVKNPVKMDVAIMAMGEQAIGKSTAVNVLALKEEWFSDAPLDISSKDYNYHIQGKLLYELAEWANRSKNIQMEKAFFTTKVDRYRPVHKTYQVAVPRRTSFWINVNRRASQFNDSTGSRRFWAIVCGLYPNGEKWEKGKMINIKALKKNALQIWLEARYYAEQKDDNGDWKHPHWLSITEDEEREKVNELFQSVHPWTSTVLDKVRLHKDRLIYHSEKKYCITIDAIMNAMDLKHSEKTSKSKRIIEMILRQNGFDKLRRRFDNVRTYVWIGSLDEG